MSFCTSIILNSFVLFAIALTVFASDSDISKDIATITSGKTLQPSKIREKTVPEKDVNFYLSTKQKKNVTITQKNISPVEPSKPVKVIIHGWTESSDSNEYYKPLTDAFLKKGDFNIITVNWSKPAHDSYPVSVVNTRGVGYRVGNLLVKIHKEKNVAVKDIHIIGHSLGAHVAGFAAKQFKRSTGTKIRHVTGLDAAGPLYETPPVPKISRLSDDDAEIVDCIHTDGGVFGYLKPLGTIDFYPNGGVPVQPGCNAVKDAFCSHHRSYKYYIKAVNEDGIATSKCIPDLRIEENNCKKNSEVKMGDNLTPDTKGIYYLKIEL